MSETFLPYIGAKSQEYAAFDPRRFPEIWDTIKSSFLLPKTVIHIVGTNGKGSTGRFLAHCCKRAGKRVGHFSSPHILHIRERFWLDGEDASDSLLEEAHQALQSVLTPMQDSTLSYFEYTALMAFKVLERSDVLILEAGLGGEFDATNVLPKTLSLITPIGLDHQEFLGESIGEIAATKLRSVTNHALVARQSSTEVWQEADKLSREKNIRFQDAESILEQAEIDSLHTYVQTYLPTYQETNLILAAAAMKVLGVECPLQNLEDVQMPGRFQRLAPNIRVDVGHNTLAAESIARLYKDKKVNLIYNSLKDKNYQLILKLLSGIIKKIYLIDIDTPRAMDRNVLLKQIDEMGFDVELYENITWDLREEYLVFGSFSVVESFLKKW